LVKDKSETLELLVADVKVSVDPEVIAEVVHPVNVPEYVPLVIPPFVVAPLARLANAAATSAARTAELPAVKVNPPIVTVSPEASPEKVTEFDSVPPDPSILTSVGRTARVPVLVNDKSDTSELLVVDVKVSVDPEVIAEVVHPVKVLE